jgi:hypothetical protein
VAVARSIQTVVRTLHTTLSMCLLCRMAGAAPEWTIEGFLRGKLLLDDAWSRKYALICASQGLVELIHLVDAQPSEVSASMKFGEPMLTPRGFREGS